MLENEGGNKSNDLIGHMDKSCFYEKTPLIDKTLCLHIQCMDKSI